MYMKVFPHGRGNGSAPTRYLVRQDYPGRDIHPPEVLRGDVERTRALIDSLDTTWRFTAGVLAWHPDDTVTPEQEQRVMDDFEAVAFAGLEEDQRAILWVRHSHAGHHELHFVIPRVELSSGRAFNPCPPGWQKDFDVFRDLHNVREGWARPDDPQRARLCTPGHANLHAARLLRWGRKPGKNQREENRQAVHDYVLTLLELGKIRTRQDIIQALEEAGLKIGRMGKNYLTVHDPGSGDKLRLKGGIYAEQCILTGRETAGQNRERKAGDRSSVSGELSRLAAAFTSVIEKRAGYNRKRYPRKPDTAGTEHQLPLPDYGDGIQPSLSAGPAVELCNPDCVGADHLGPADAVTVPNQGSGAGDFQPERPAGTAGSAKCLALEQLQGAGAVSDRRQNLSSDAGGTADRPCGQGGPTGRLGSGAEVRHDRNGTDAERKSADSGRGTCREAAPAGIMAFRPADPHGGSGTPDSGLAPGGPPATGGTADIDAALAALERRTRELIACADALEQRFGQQIGVPPRLHMRR